MVDITLLKEWFLEEKRDLPWRKENPPYEIWISEIMLQQTQVAVVVDYFERWMKKFPTLGHLASASLEEVMKMWEGLGYYSRARFIHETARIIERDYQGIFPSKKEELEKLKGFGPYTVGAVLSFAFHQRSVAVDGNVIRVISRLFHIEEDVSKRIIFEAIVDSILPEEEPWVMMEALIELGAQVCRKVPLCDQCPLQNGCLSYERGDAHLFPIRKKKSKAERLYRDVAVIIYKDSVLLRKGKVGRIMEGLYEFPYVERGKSWDFDLKLCKEKELTVVQHGFTRFIATLYPVLYRVEKKIEIQEYEWLTQSEMLKCSFSSGHKRILKEVLRENFTH